MEVVSQPKEEHKQTQRSAVGINPNDQYKEFDYRSNNQFLRYKKLSSSQNDSPLTCINKKSGNREKTIEKRSSSVFYRLDFAI